MSTGTGCNCQVILANISYDEAAITYEQAQIDYHLAQKAMDEDSLNHWNLESYRCGCTTTAQPKENPASSRTAGFRTKALLVQRNLQKDRVKKSLDSLRIAAEKVKEITGTYPPNYDGPSIK